MGQGDNGFLVSHAFTQALVVGPQVRPLATGGGASRFHEGLTQPSVPFACFRTQPFARTDLGLRTRARPGDEMSFGRKAIHHRPHFGHHDLINAHIDARDLIKDADHLGAAQRGGAIWRRAERLWMLGG